MSSNDNNNESFEGQYTEQRSLVEALRLIESLHPGEPLGLERNRDLLTILRVRRSRNQDVTTVDEWALLLARADDRHLEVVGLSDFALEFAHEAFYNPESKERVDAERINGIMLLKLVMLSRAITSYNRSHPDKPLKHAILHQTAAQLLTEVLGEVGLGVKFTPIAEQADIDPAGLVRDMASEEVWVHGVVPEIRNPNKGPQFAKEIETLLGTLPASTSLEEARNLLLQDGVLDRWHAYLAGRGVDKK